MPLARRSAGLWAANEHRQPLQSLVAAPRLAAHFRENGGRRPSSGRALHRLKPRQGAALGKRLKKGELAEAMGRSRVGRTSKIQPWPMIAAPVAFALTPGNRADVLMAVRLLEALARPGRLLANKAYDADSLRNWPKQGQIKAVAPSTAHSLSSRRQGLQAQKRHRTHVPQAEQLATHRNAIRPRRAKTNEGKVLWAIRGALTSLLSEKIEPCEPAR
jgi:hypothetical protein